MSSCMRTGGSAPNKRWMARAIRHGGFYRALPPELAGPPANLLARLRAAAGPSSCVFLGFDFPIGVPAAYANLASVQDFLSLPRLPGPGTMGGVF